MTTTFFDSVSHADFLRLTLEAFKRQGYKVEPSRDAGADSVLVGKTGARIGILCKKYRGAFIGRPVLQQFYGAMRQLRCKEGYLVTTTDCSPDAYEFAAGKGIVLYNRERTMELLRTAFGDEFLGQGRMPELGKTAKAAPSAARQTISPASYDKVEVSEQKQAPEPVRTPEPVRAPEPIRVPEHVLTPEPISAPGSVQTPEPVQAPEPEKAGSEHSPQEMAAIEELPEEVQDVQELQDVPGLQDVQGTGASEAPETVPSGKMTVIVCLECNKQLQVPIDQGMITVQCPECGMRRVYQPELDEAGELKTTTVIGCPSCKQKLNVPTNRGQLNVRCPRCGEKSLFTP